MTLAFFGPCDTLIRISADLRRTKSRKLLGGIESCIGKIIIIFGHSCLKDPGNTKSFQMRKMRNGGFSIK